MRPRWPPAGGAPAGGVPPGVCALKRGHGNESKAEQGEGGEVPDTHLNYLRE